MNRYTKRDEIIDAIGCFLLMPLCWVIWTLAICVFQ